MSLLFQTCGIIYLMVFLKEPRDLIDENECGIKQIEESNKVEEKSDDDESPLNHNNSIGKEIVEAVRKIFFVLMRRRPENRRMIVWLLLFSSFVFVGCTFGRTVETSKYCLIVEKIFFISEITNEYFFVRTKLNWEALEESPFAAYSSGTAFFGSILMTTVFSKYFKISDTIIGFISSAFSMIAKFLCVRFWNKILQRDSTL